MPNFNEIFPVYESNYDVIYEGYKTELLGLAALLLSKNKSEYLHRITEYRNFDSLITDRPYKKKINKLFKKGTIINVSQQSEILTDIFLTSHLAICCELLDGVQISLSELKSENIESTLQKLLAKYKNLKNTDSALQNLEAKLHSIDAFRTVQILKALGLYTLESKDISQLSLGVGSGSKDLRSIHLRPELKISSNNSLSFSVIKSHAKNVILVDGDPQRKDAFKMLNKNQNYPIVAINDNAFDALLKIPDIIKERNLGLRNAVIALRIDHRMIPNVEEFFKSLQHSIDDVSYLLVTIGSGFDIDDFKGRTAVIQDMYNFLKGIGLCPVLLKLHAKGTLEEQWNDHAFGLKSITTYQILYCKLKKNILKKQCNQQ